MDNTAELIPVMRSLVARQDYKGQLVADIQAQQNSGTGFIDLVKRAISYLGSQRIDNQYRADTLNDLGLVVGDDKWNRTNLSFFAARNGIRMAPQNDRLYTKFVEGIAKQHEFLPYILEQVREGNTSYDSIRKGLQKKYGGEVYDWNRSAAVVVPREAIIARVLRFCKNDSPELAAEIEGAFKQGEAARPQLNRPIDNYLNHIKKQTAAALDC